jgi:hypothetical protein
VVNEPQQADIVRPDELNRQSMSRNVEIVHSGGFDRLLVIDH